MGIRGELFTNQVNLDKRSYYFNVKENRNGDVFLQIVESKIKDGQDERRDIVVFADDMKSFLGGMDESLRAVEKIQKERAKLRAEKKAAISKICSKRNVRRKASKKSLPQKRRKPLSFRKKSRAQGNFRQTSCCFKKTA